MARQSVGEAGWRRGARRAAGWAVVIAAIAAGRSAAGPVTVVGGFDHYAGALGQTTNGALGAVVVGAGGGDVMLAGVRYDDSFNGTGVTFTGGVGAPLAPAVMLRVNASRIIGDAGFRAWRAKVGPQFTLPAGPALTLSYAHYQDHLGIRSHGAIAEATLPLVTRLSARAGASCATSPQGPAALQGTVGLGWTVVPRLELSGEVGLARNAAGATGQSSPGGGVLAGLPILGGGNPGGNSASQERGYDVDTTLLIGMRVTLP